jgi:hypothetical protein
MSKVIFVVHRRSDMSREECHEHWGGEDHASIVRTLPGLTRAVQNHVVSAPGELWFASDAAMEQALSSPAMEAAVEHAKDFPRHGEDRTGHRPGAPDRWLK